jgi:hypothetical protein
LHLHQLHLQLLFRRRKHELVVSAQAGTQYSAALPGLLDPRLGGDDTSRMAGAMKRFRFTSLPPEQAQEPGE